ncbi:hypothetical protein MJO29_015915 [Puccinia striiformis f. sp. tritici]|nr:hypothetical protein MJO29_015915 [Puccinia striiformis f. sp. tritici]
MSIHLWDPNPNNSHLHFTLAEKNKQSNTTNKFIIQKMVPQGLSVHEPFSVQLSQFYHNLTRSNSISIGISKTLASHQKDLVIRHLLVGPQFQDPILIVFDHQPLFYLLSIFCLSSSSQW